MRTLRILLENTAGQGDCIGHRFEHLREIMNACPKLPLGVCFDTAHAFTAGYDIREEDGLEALIDKLQRTVGTRNVRAIHFNDSRAVYNSRVDRHWHIGEGHIGREALRRFAQHPKLAHAAFILETPYDDPRADLKNLEALRSFVEEKGYIWDHEVATIEKRRKEERIFTYCMSVGPVDYHKRIRKFPVFRGGKEWLPQRGHAREEFLLAFAKEVIEKKFLHPGKAERRG